MQMERQQATSKIALTGTLSNEETYVLYHKDASDAIKSKGQLENASVINFNGDDALVLKKSGEVIDSFGQVGARVTGEPMLHWSGVPR